MGDCYIVRRGGGGSTTTKIINATSKSDLPEITEPGTVAIVSSIAIGETFVQAEEPEAPNIGDVWFVPGAKLDVIYVQEGMPIAVETVWQYTGEEWVSVVAYQFINDAWELEVFLLNGTDECTTITGGWTLNNTKASFYKGSNYIQLHKPTSNTGTTSLMTVNTIDLSRFTTLYCDVKSISVASAGSANNTAYFGVAGAAEYKITKSGVFALDVSGVTSETKIYLSVYTYSSGNYVTLQINKMWLE